MKSISKFKLPIMVIGALVLSIIWHACKKENQIVNEDNGNEIAMRNHLDHVITKNPDNLKLLAELNPFGIRKEQEILKFDCYGDYLAFVDKLRDIDQRWVNEYVDKEDDIIVPHESLDAFEQMMNFRSFRKDIEEKEIALFQSEIDELNLENHPNKTSIRDLYTMTVMSSGKEVIINNSIFKYIDNETEIEITNLNFSTLNKINNGMPFKNLPDVIQYHVKLERGVCGNGICEKWACETEENCEDCIPLGKGNSGSSVTGCTPTILTVDDEPGTGCNVLTYNFWLTPKFEGCDLPTFEVKWDFGDGIIATNTGTGNFAEQNVEHTFAKAGTYKVKATLTGTCIDGLNPQVCTGSVTEEWTIVAGDNSEKNCDHGDIVKSESWKNYVNDRAMYYEIAQTHGLFFKGYTASTRNLKVKDNGKLGGYKDVGKDNTINATVRGVCYYSKCQSIQSVYGYKGWYNWFEANAKDDIDFDDFGSKPGEITSTHKITIDGTDYIRTITLPANPECK